MLPTGHTKADYKNLIDSRTSQIDDIASAIDESGHLDKIYARISIGNSMDEIASDYELTTETLEYILSHDAKGIEKNLVALTIRNGNQSLKSMEYFSKDMKFMSNEQSKAATFHQKNVDLAMKAIKSITGTDMAQQIVIINETVINNEIPTVPNDILEVLDA